MSSNRSRPSRFTSASEAPQSAALQLASSLVQNMYTSPPPSVLFLSQPPPPPPSNSFGNHFGQRQALLFVTLQPAYLTGLETVVLLVQSSVER
uniref:Uncharacterized protein n=1 Tax=Timema cristinae TaxID=61476 RepID=A0A7R9GTB1_TIMCR|nr:unnamed protein product [Timema cristinae]